MIRRKIRCFTQKVTLSRVLLLSMLLVATMDFFTAVVWSGLPKLLTRWGKIDLLTKVNDFCGAMCVTQTRQFNILYVRGGEWGDVAVERFVELLLPEYDINTTSEDLNRDYVEQNIDLVVEGPPQFARFSQCPPRHIPWAQYIAEPLISYKNGKWCNHSSPPLFRLDTSLEYLAYTDSEPETQFIWTPYASVIMAGYLKQVHDVHVNIKIEEWRSRPYFMAWIATNCKSRERTRAIEFMLEEAKNLNQGGFHSLGPCLPNTNISIPPRNNGWISAVDVYRKYRFVICFESELESGYVTEKLVSAIAAGAIPVYYGDSDAARLIFKRTPFLDVKDIWNSRKNEVNVSNPTGKDWADVFREVHFLDKDIYTLNNFLNASKNQGRGEKETKFPNLPFPTHELDVEILTRVRNKLFSI